MTPADGERTALKEWSVLVDAMAAGDITVLVRKGGIREQRAGFSVRHDRFLLYPTFFHEGSVELAPRFRHALTPAARERAGPGMIRLTHLATVAGVWTVAALEPLRAIAPEYGLDWTAAERRFHYRGIPEVKVIAVRTSRLSAAAELPEARRYGGCVSWVELDMTVDVAGASPVLDDASFAQRFSVLQAALGKPEIVR